MNDEEYNKLLQQTKEIVNTLEVMITYTRRHKILIEKLINYDLPPSFLEEFGEFLIDWGKVLTKYGELNKERDNLLKEIIEGY